MSNIDDKYNQLKHNGFDLGIALGSEEDAGWGGRVRRYANGNIYYHPSTGANEVHGGVLSLYLANGGPGVNPSTGNRDLGFPLTDQIAGDTPYSMFEWGAIYWVRNTGGCVLYGSIYETYKGKAGMGYPLTSVIKVAGGLAAYFGAGVIFSPNGGGDIHKVLIGYLAPPRMGQPLIADPSVLENRQFLNWITFPDLPKEDYNKLVAWRPTLFADLWNGRLLLAPVGMSAQNLPLVSYLTHLDDGQIVTVHVYLQVSPKATDGLQNRTLYDLRLILSNGNLYSLSPHCLYAKHGWESFGMLHVTDIHISGRNEGYRSQLQIKGQTDAAQHYNNFQDNFRDFIKYANHLHDLGIADLVWATGDLVDYVYEEGEDAFVGNFRRLRNLVLGQPIDDGGLVSQELKLPFFPTFGNHDYRVKPYYLTSDIDPVNHYHAVGIDEFGSHNLTESEAIALQGGSRPSFGLTDLNDALKSLQWDRVGGHAYDYFSQWFTPHRSYVVPLGIHRLVMLDTQMDAGVPEEIDIGFIVDLATNSLPSDTQQIIDTGSANLEGPVPSDLDLLKTAIGQAGTDGLVIVGIHAPAIDQSGEYAYYLRETVHASTDQSLISEYVTRHKLNPTGWPTLTPYFYAGDGSNGLSGGTFNGRKLDFLKICAGVGVARPVDLILCGHKHQWVEHRFAWNAAASRLEFYWDFYSENPPSVYYSTVNGFDHGELPKNARIQVHVDPAATVPPVLTIVRDHATGIGAPAGTPATVYGSIKAPPYSQPLLTSNDSKTWWHTHRPLHAMTSALGPIESRQRSGAFYKIVPPDLPFRPEVESNTPPSLHHALNSAGLNVMQQSTSQAGPLREPTFQGFRLIQVQANVIQRMHYITLADLRRNNFKLAWEHDPSRSGIATIAGNLAKP